MRILISRLRIYITISIALLIIHIRDKLPKILIFNIFIIIIISQTYILYNTFKKINELKDKTPLIINIVSSFIKRADIETTYFKHDSDNLRWLICSFFQSILYNLVFTYYFNTDALILLNIFNSLSSIIFEPLILVHFWKRDIIRPFFKAELCF